MEPPRRADHQAGPVAGHRRELAGISGFVEHEHDQAQVGLVAAARQQGLEAIHVIGGAGYIGTEIGAALGHQQRIGIAARAGVKLHDHAIFDRQQSHFGHHLGAEQLGIGGVMLA
jgi:hypothetical protein